MAELIETYSLLSIIKAKNPSTSSTNWGALCTSIQHVHKTRKGRTHATISVACSNCRWCYCDFTRQSPKTLVKLDMLRKQFLDASLDFYLEANGH